MRNIIFIFIIAIFSNCVFSQIGSKVSSEQWIGIWKASMYGEVITLELNKDGKGKLDGEPFTYEIKNQQFLYTQFGQTTTYNFSLSGNTLKLSGGDLAESLVFTKNEQINKDNTSTQTTKNDIVGTWTSSDETLIFKENGTLIYSGMEFTYKISGNLILIETQLGTSEFTFKLNGNNLTLSAFGEEMYYSRTGNNNQTSQNNQQSGGRVAQELVGKWCWVNVTSTNTGGSSSEQCITLHPDGRYEYYGESSRSVNTEGYYGGTSSQSSDEGTWSYDGQKIYWNSSKGNGSGSYNLEKRNHPKNGDPMIVLDGETYVTYYQKPSW